jgi:HAMP domain-containing protein
MGLRIKILSGFLILTAMLFIAGVWSIYELSSIGISVQRLLDDNYKSINAAKTMIEALEREDSAVLLLLSGKWEQGRSIMESADSFFQKGFEVAKNNITIPGEQEYVNDIESNYKTYKALWIKPVVGTKSEGNLSWYFQKVHRAFLDAKISVEKLMTLNDETMYRTASDLKNRAHRAIMPGIVAILSALIFTVIFNYLINYYMVSPIIKITEGIQKFIKGREPFDVKVETQDELYHLVSAIQELCARSRSSEAAE